MFSFVAVCWSNPKDCDHFLSMINKETGILIGDVTQLPMFYCNTCGTICFFLYLLRLVKIYSLDQPGFVLCLHDEVHVLYELKFGDYNGMVIVAGKFCILVAFSFSSFLILLLTIFSTVTFYFYHILITSHFKTGCHLVVDLHTFSIDNIDATLLSFLVMTAILLIQVIHK